MRAREIFPEIGLKRSPRQGMEVNGRFEHGQSVLVHIARKFNAPVTFPLPNRLLHSFSFSTHDGGRSSQCLESLNRSGPCHPPWDCPNTLLLFDIPGECLIFSGYLISCSEWSTNQIFEMDFSIAIGKVPSTEAYSETKPAANQPQTGRQDRREGVPSTGRLLAAGRASWRWGLG